ncbi:MAG: ABC transporter ATP-binding protein [Puniceicoccales bacterium]|nr:ABC transporter ATP-binding protein [Puniceicoccales bacterium]
MADIIRVEELSKRYGKFVALGNISFALPFGRIIGLIGPNGAGKTSLLKILSGLMSATSGQVSICGVDLVENPALAKEKISFMPETNPLPDHMRVGEYLRFRATLRGIKNVRLCVEKVMRKCDLYYNARYRIIKNLSKGYRQRVGIADALLGDSELIILDEPTIGLDPKQIILIRQTLLELRGSRTLLISSHILSELETICDYFIIINCGEIVAMGSLADIYKSKFDSNVMHIDLSPSGITDEAVASFLGENRLVRLSASHGKICENLRIEFRFDGHCAGEIIKSAVDHFGENLLSIGRESSSLEEIFLSTTRRYGD